MKKNKEFIYPNKSDTSVSFLEKFDSKIVIKQYIDLYKKILNDNKRLK